MTGRVRVAGQGLDLWDLYPVGSDEKVDFTSTGKALKAPIGKYEIQLNGIRRPVTVVVGAEAVVPSAMLEVAGLGRDLCEVWDAEGKRKLNFKFTNKPFELLAGDYQVKLNGVAAVVRIKPPAPTIVKPGSVLVRGDGNAQYAVFDKPGRTKLNFTQVGKPIELLAGEYLVETGGKKLPAVVVAGKQTIVKP